MVGLETHWPPLLKDGLMGCMQPLSNSRGRVVIVVVTTMWRVVVIVVVHRLVGIIILLLAKEVGVEVSAYIEMVFFFFKCPTTNKKKQKTKQHTKKPPKKTKKTQTSKTCKQINCLMDIQNQSKVTSC